MKALKNLALLILLGILSGVICGALGAFFSKAVGFVTNIRSQHEWILFLLPVAGLLSVGIYKLFRVKNIGTTNIFDCVLTEQNLPSFLAPAIFCATCISHLFGASVGREGAALQIGGSVADTLSRIFKLDENSRHITIMCGMAALFSAVFGTPFAAWIFVLEVIASSICFISVFPILLSSLTAFAVAQLLHIHPERFDIGNLPQFSISFLWKTVLIIIACVLVAFIFCKGLNLGKKFAKKTFKNEFLRIAIGGILTVGLTVLVNSSDYNGGGIDIINRVFEGSVKYEAFAIKLLFTVICVSFGYKGGEIIPTLFIGATLGGALGAALGLPIGTAAAIGMAVLFVCATKCPVATIFICGEMFGFGCLTTILPVVIISFLIAQYKGLYNNSNILLTLIGNTKKLDF